MRKSLVRTFYLIGLIGEIAGVVLISLGVANSQLQSTGPYSSTVSSLGNPSLFYAGIGLVSLFGIFILVAWIGALVKTAQLGRWGWFVCLIVLSGITLLVYIFAGPETPANQVAQGQYNPAGPYNQYGGPPR